MLGFCSSRKEIPTLCVAANGALLVKTEFNRGVWFGEEVEEIDEQDKMPADGVG